MGEIADAIIDGEMCEGCGVFLSGDAPGHTRMCKSCGGDANEFEVE